MLRLKATQDAVGVMCLAGPSEGRKKRTSNDEWERMDMMDEMDLVDEMDGKNIQ